jgi:hypothetical protein
VSADITHDRKSCQFAFLLNEKPTVVSVGDVVGDGVRPEHTKARSESKASTRRGIGADQRDTARAAPCGSTAVGADFCQEEGKRGGDGISGARLLVA